jgi:hypothetical protein
MHLQPKTQSVEECLRICQGCHEICQDAIDHCLRMGGEHVEADHMRLLADCAEICNVSQNSMLRSSATSLDLCRSCAEICDRCAASCERFTGDAHMQACARECRACAEACRRMVGGMSHGAVRGVPPPR